ncbi:MAG: gephyrin-like molybdotransferase Glp, partial [Terriglobia bacterium]
MISCREALGIILGEVKTLPARALPFSETLGLVLAEDITSGHDIPPFANSSMDGFSVRASDIKGASGDSPVRLRITGEMQAGDGRDLSLQPGTAIRIMTGAPVPGGSDTVVPKEETKTVGDTVHIRREFPEGRYVRPKGEDVRQGSKVLKAGLVIGPATLGFLASLGVSEVKVVPRPAVSVVGTGNELVEADEPLKPGQIRDSNSHSLVAQIDAMGACGSRVGVARDTKEDTLAKIRAALEADVVITIGGVSVGEYDFVNDVLAGLGAEQKFYKLRQEPGKPLAFWVL